MPPLTKVEPASPDARSEIDAPIDTIDQPRSGDIVVSPDPDAPGHFTIRQMPENPSMWLDSRGKAMGVALGFARARSVNVWFQQPGLSERLHVYRSTVRRSR